MQRILPVIFVALIYLLPGTGLQAQENPCRESDITQESVDEFLQRIISEPSFDVNTLFRSCFLNYSDRDLEIFFVAEELPSEGSFVRISKSKSTNINPTQEVTLQSGSPTSAVATALIDFNNPDQYGFYLRFFQEGVFRFTVINSDGFDGSYTKSVVSAAPVNWVKDLAYTSYGENQLSFSWAVSEQRDVAGYELERMVGVGSFEKVADVPYHEYGNLEVTYTAIADRVGQSAYYRVKQLDHAGTYDYSNVVFVPGNDGAEQQFSMFPNPATDYVRMSVPESIQNVDLISASGQVVRSVSANDVRREGIDVRNVPAGMYFVRPVGGNGAARPQRLLVNH